VLGLDHEIRIEPADTMNPADSVRQQNPLGKIPALVLEDGTVLFDSRVILEYLDHRAGGGRIVPTEASARFAAIRCGMSYILPSMPSVPASGWAAKAATTRRAWARSASDGVKHSLMVAT